MNKAKTFNLIILDVLDIFDKNASQALRDAKNQDYLEIINGGKWWNFALTKLGAEVMQRFRLRITKISQAFTRLLTSIYDSKSLFNKRFHLAPNYEGAPILCAP